jgi:hypothetical protein
MKTNPDLIAPCGLFRIGVRLVLKSGFKMKRPAISVLSAAINFSGAL